jgi:hypothetical protein
MSYITTADITDSVALAFIANSDSRVAAWITNVDNEIKRLALTQGLTEGEIFTPLNSIVKEYAVNYFCLLVFKDNIGSNNIDVPDDEKYVKKYNLYVSECSRLRPLCTKALLSMDEDSVEASEMTGVSYFIRS